MVLAAIILPMLFFLYYGKRIEELNPRHYGIVAFVTLLQVSVAVYAMFTMEMPPVF